MKIISIVKGSIKHLGGIPHEKILKVAISVPSHCF